MRTLLRSLSCQIRTDNIVRICLLLAAGSRRTVAPAKPKFGPDTKVVFVLGGPGAGKVRKLSSTTGSWDGAKENARESPDGILHCRGSPLLLGSKKNRSGVFKKG